MRRLPLRNMAGFAVSIISLAAVLWWASRQEAPRLPTAVGDLALLGLALLVYGAATLARGSRWRAVLRHAGIEHAPGDAYALICVGYMGNTVLPARGGEALRVLLLAERSGARRREILGSILAERIFDVVALVLLFAMLTFVEIAGAPAGESPAFIALGGLLVGALALSAYLRLRRAGRFARFAEILRPVAGASKILVSRVGAVLVLVTIGVWLAEGLIFNLVGQSLGLDVSLLEGVFLVVLASFFALIPAAPGYVGTFDAALLFGLAALGIAGGVALSFAILVRLVLFGPVTLVGLVLLLTRYGGIGGVLRRRDRAPDESASATSSY